MSGLHIDDAGPGTSGLRELREFARDLGRQNGVNQVVIRGRDRATVAKPCHTPMEITIRLG